MSVKRAEPLNSTSNLLRISCTQPRGCHRFLEPFKIESGIKQERTNEENRGALGAKSGGLLFGACQQCFDLAAMGHEVFIEL